MKRKGLVALILILLLLLAICGAGFVMMNYAVVNFHLYPKTAGQTFSCRTLPL